MHEFVLVAGFFVLAGVALWRPFAGALAWVLLLVGSPQTIRGFAAVSFPLAGLVEIVVIGRWLFSREPKRPPADPVVWLMLAYIAWTTLTTFLALFQAGAWFLWGGFFKFALGNLVLLVMLTSRERIEALIWTICLSLSYVIARDGLHTLTTGGKSLAYGPNNTAIAGNNEFGLALLMVLPLIVYLARVAPWRWLKFAMWGEFLLAVVSTAATYSRGSLGGLAVLGGVALLQLQRRLAALGVAIVLAIAAAQFFPAYWLHRVASIEQAGTDTSLEGRFDAWKHAIHVVEARPLTGGGMGTFSIPVFYKYSPDLAVRAAHSIYFQTLGEQGLVGLTLFLALMAAAFRNCFLVVRAAQGRPELAAAGLLARCLMCSLLGYATAGALLSLANLNLYYMVLAATVGLRRCLDEAAPRPAPPATMADQLPAPTSAGQ